MVSVPIPVALNMYKCYLLWGLKYRNTTYFGLCGVPGYWLLQSTRFLRRAAANNGIGMPILPEFLRFWYMRSCRIFTISSSGRVNTTCGDRASNSERQTCLVVKTTQNSLANDDVDPAEISYKWDG